MVILAKLLRARGRAREILRTPSADPVVWTDSHELAHAEVVRGIMFDAFIINDAKIGLDFVECEFARCSFKNLSSERHWWGAGDRWSNCRFERCDMNGVIAPMNTFTGCHFDKVDFKIFKPHQTLFDRCSFSHCNIEGMKALLISNSQIVNRDFGSGGGQLLFRNCGFTGTAFRQCYFAGVVFQRCTFERTIAEGCSFLDVTSDVRWWGQQTTDPFSVFLTHALDLIRTKCGPASAAYREFENYVSSYRSGQTASDDFSACLYTDRVPYAEIEKISAELRKLVAKFPF